MNPLALRQHVLALGDAFGVEVTEVPNMLPEAAYAGCAIENAVSLEPPQGVVRCAPITEETTYAVALHELGHVLDPQGSLWHEEQAALKAGDTVRYYRIKLHQEDAAWNWAKHHACDWTPAMQFVNDWARGTYVEAVQFAELHAARIASERARMAAAAARAASPQGQREANERAAKAAATIHEWIRKRGRL